MGKHTTRRGFAQRFNYTRQQGRTYVSCTACGINLVPAPTSFEEDPVCQGCTPRQEISQRAHFAGLVAMLCAAEAAVLCVVLGFDGIATVYRVVWDMITPW